MRVFVRFVRGSVLVCFFLYILPLSCVKQMVGLNRESYKDNILRLVWYIIDEPIWLKFALSIVFDIERDKVGV